MTFLFSFFSHEVGFMVVVMEKFSNQYIMNFSFLFPLSIQG